MRTTLIISLFLLIVHVMGNAQTYAFDRGSLSILAIAPIDTVSAVSEKMEAKLDLKKKTIFFKSEVENFVFGNQLILTNLSREILNVKEYPSFSFTGNYKEALSSTQEKFTTLYIKGVLIFNGVSRNIETEAKLKMLKDKANVKFTTGLNLIDYKVSIPTILQDALSSHIIVSLDINMSKNQNVRRLRE